MKNKFRFITISALLAVLAVAQNAINRANGVNAQTGTTYTILDGDRAKLVTFSNGSSVAVTLPQANSTTFISGWYIDAQNRGAGTVTITPTTSTIDGASSLALSQNQGVRIVSDGTNYYTQRGVGSGAGGSVSSFNTRTGAVTGTVGDVPITTNAQTGTTYTVVSGDNGKLVTLSNGSSIAVTLPQATGSFTTGWFAYFKNIGAGTVTITPTTSTISGASTLTLSTGEVALVTSDGTNYEAQQTRLTAGTGITLTKTRTGVQVDASGSGAPSGTTGQIAGYPSSSTQSTMWLTTSVGAVYLPNPTYIRLQLSNQNTGDHDFTNAGSAYTVPSNRRTLCSNMAAYNSNTAVNVYPEVKISGSYYGLNNQTSSGGAIGGNGYSAAVGYIAEAGEAFAINSNTANGTNASMNCIEFDNTSQLKSAKITTFINGDNTLFTCPNTSGTTCEILNVTMTTGTPAINAWTGVSATYKVNIVPCASYSGATCSSSGTVGTGNLFATPGATSGGAKYIYGADVTLGPGDFINLNSTTNSATQIGWVNVVVH